MVSPLSCRRRIVWRPRQRFYPAAKTSLIFRLGWNCEGTMNSNISQPSVARIVKSDYVALLTVLSPVVFWLMYLALAYFGYLPNPRGRKPLSDSDAPFFLKLALITTFICLPLLIWRVRHFQTVFANGEAVNGRIAKVSFFRDRGRIEFTYTYAGRQYHAKNALHKTKEATAFKEGDEVVIVVSRSNPKRSYIRDLFV
jgi:hypothetical protein